jgi:hypothetical protein
MNARNLSMSEAAGAGAVVLESMGIQKKGRMSPPFEFYRKVRGRPVPPALDPVTARREP